MIKRSVNFILKFFIVIINPILKRHQKSIKLDRGVLRGRNIFSVQRSGAARTKFRHQL